MTLPPAADPDDEQDDGDSDGEARAQAVAPPRRQNGLAGLPQVQAKEYEQHEAEERQRPSPPRADGGRPADWIGRRRATPVADDGFVGDFSAALTAGHGHRSYARRDLAPAVRNVTKPYLVQIAQVFARNQNPDDRHKDQDKPEGAYDGGAGRQVELE